MTMFEYEAYNELKRLGNKCDAALSGQALGRFIMAVRQRGKKYAYNRLAEEVRPTLNSSHTFNIADSSGVKIIKPQTGWGSFSPEAITLYNGEETELGGIAIETNENVDVKLQIKVSRGINNILYRQDVFTKLTLGGHEILTADADTFINDESVQGFSDYCMYQNWTDAPAAFGTIGAGSVTGVFT